MISMWPYPVKQEIFCGIIANLEFETSFSQHQEQPCDFMEAVTLYLIIQM